MTYPVISLRFDAVRLIGQLAALTQKFIVPRSAFFCLDAIFITDLHQKFAFVHEARELAPQCAAAFGEVLYHQIGYGIDGRLDADLIIVAGQLVDQENKTARTRRQLLIFRPLYPTHGLFVDFAGQDSGLKQFVGGIEIDIVAFDDITQSGIQIGLDGLMDHTELVAELTVGARRVQNP